MNPNINKASATSNKPNTPIVEFTTSLPVLIPANLKSPCSKLFGIVIKLDKLFKTFPVPFFIGVGKALYPFATGLKITLSKPWLKAKEALFTFSKQSLAGFAFLESLISPSDPANALDDRKIIIKNTGSTNLTSLKIEYWVNGSTTKEVQIWNGNLDFEEYETVELDAPATIWDDLFSSNKFYVEISEPNQSSDENIYNKN